MHWEIHPPWPSRFPSGGGFAPLGPRDCPREISRASGDVFPNTSLLSAVYGYNTHHGVHGKKMCNDQTHCIVSRIPIDVLFNLVSFFLLTPLCQVCLYQKFAVEEKHWRKAFCIQGHIGGGQGVCHQMKRGGRGGRGRMWGWGWWEGEGEGGGGGAISKSH